MRPQSSEDGWVTSSSHEKIMDGKIMDGFRKTSTLTTSPPRCGYVTRRSPIVRAACCESATGADGSVRAGAGVASARIGRETRLRVDDAILTGVASPRPDVPPVTATRGPL